MYFLVPMPSPSGLGITRCSSLRVDRLLQDGLWSTRESSRRAEETSCGFVAICMPLPGDTILWSAARGPVPTDGAVAQWQMEPPYLKNIWGCILTHTRFKCAHLPLLSCWVSPSICPASCCSCTAHAELVPLVIAAYKARSSFGPIPPPLHFRRAPHKLTSLPDLALLLHNGHQTPGRKHEW